MIFNEAAVLDGASAVQDTTENRMMNGNVMNEPMTFTNVSIIGYFFLRNDMGHGC